MRQEIATFDEVSLYAFGLDRTTVQTLRNIVRIVGKATDSITVPEVAADTEANTVSVTSLQLLVTATQLAIRELESEQGELPAPDHSMQQQIAELRAELERNTAENRRLVRAIEEMQADQQQIGIENNKLSRRVADLENGVN